MSLKWDEKPAAISSAPARVLPLNWRVSVAVDDLARCLLTSLWNSFVSYSLKSITDTSKSWRCWKRAKRTSLFRTLRASFICLKDGHSGSLGQPALFHTEWAILLPCTAVAIPSLQIVNPFFDFLFFGSGQDVSEALRRVDLIMPPSEGEGAYCFWCGSCWRRR